MLKRTVILSFSVGVAIAMSACRDRGAKLEQALIKTIKQGAGTVFWMRDLTPFEWERMYVIQPYTGPESINRKLGFEWARASRSGIQDTDTIRLLLFVKEKAVVAEVEYKVWDGFFEGDGGAGYGIEEAKFMVVEEGEKGQKAVTIKRAP